MSSEKSRRSSGLLVVFVSTVLWSTAGLFVRMARLDTWSIVGWRSAFAFSVLGLFWLFAGDRKMVRLRDTATWSGAAAVMISIVSNVTYIAALQLTSVANVMTVYAILPFAATAIAFVALRERVTATFIVCGLLATLGIAVTSGAAISRNDLLGLAAALVMTVTFAASLVQAKRYPALDMTLVTVGSAAGCAVIALPLMQTFAPSAHQLVACALLGILTTGIASVMSLVGRRLLGSGETAFLLVLDVVLGPLWVWLFYSEKVDLQVLAGGTTVIAAVAWYLLVSMRTEPALPR